MRGALSFFNHALRLAAVLGVLGVLWLGGNAQARLQPYYVVRAVSTTTINPRVLFVLDTSGSMAYRAQATEEDCSFDTCEDGTGTQQSRIAAARKAITQVITATQSTARFAMMTFDQLRPPSPNAAVPAKCGIVLTSRFRWTTSFHSPALLILVWHVITGRGGAWELCDADKNRGYPYLRWDDLGPYPTILSNLQVGPIPLSPLTAPVVSLFSDIRHAQRKVQWFPKFMGVRVRLNASTDPDGSILAGTVGDWGTTPATRTANVLNQDFYYWPYVDGFPGYSAHLDFLGGHMGVTMEDSATNQAMLYAPFYLDLSSSTVPVASRGPTSNALALAEVTRLASPFITGGVDVDGGTPWKSVIGKVADAAPDSNATFAHSTVASYLKFVTTAGHADACAPTIAVLVTDGEPSSGEGGAELYARLANLRKTLGVRTYVVGFFASGGELQAMACAAAGGCDGTTCSTPCDDAPTQAWDTCADPSAPLTKCAWTADSAETLAAALQAIVTQALSLEVTSGAATRMAEYDVGADADDIVQTEVRAWTEAPRWRGHVARELCTTRDPANPAQLAPWCVDPSPAFAVADVEPTFGPCPQSRSWDAGVCLQQTSWNARRIYTQDANHNLVAIANSNGTASAPFVAMLLAQGLVASGTKQTQANAIVAFVLGRDAPGGWKLPGLGGSAPAVVRRIAPVDPSVTPSVAIRDPHCAGRAPGEVDAPLPTSLEQFAKAAWTDRVASPSSHLEYQEAVLVGDDMGVLHAFDLDSGNELWGLLPSFMLKTAAEQSARGAATMGQPAALESHHYGMSATANHGWVFDARNDASHTPKWRHLAVVGLGAGGKHYLALDVSHMSPSSPKGPVEVLWTTADAALAPSYSAWLGETWARPAISYHVPNDTPAVEPIARLVLGSGYRGSSGPATMGTAMIVADAVTGAVVESAQFPALGTTMFDTQFGAIVDPAIGTHCLSNFWAEMQEAYIADHAGRLFRWDLGRTTAHAADGGGVKWAGTATPSVWLPACEGSGATCTVSASNRGDPFVYSAAVSSAGRIDDGSGGAPPEDRFLVALVSGSHTDDATDPTLTTHNFHTSLYLLADDHSTPAKRHLGFDVPAGANKQTPATLGSHAHFARLAVTDISRTRTYKPFASSPTQVETRNFSRGTRAIRSPKIETEGVVNAETVGSSGGTKLIGGVEVVRVTYTLYEPPAGTCDAKWYDATQHKWVRDEGATYEVKLRVTATRSSGFDFTNGASSSAVKFSPSFKRGLVLESVTQVTSDGCADGNCGPQLNGGDARPCTAAPVSATTEPQNSAPTSQVAQIDGFSPVE